ncbi:response regulator [Rhodohalobacter sp. 8-1]|uniref:response regulator n=1 Tax=Rhodohalobacter sp. 8-1 TaxID=3131972 RepID=UPI0030EF0566
MNYKRIENKNDILSNDSLCVKMKLFIVEDDRIQSLILEIMVSKLGLQHIGTEASGENAVKQIVKNKPDIVLLDIMLKDSYNGIDVAREIKKVYEPVIIYITGNSDFVHKSRAREYGFHDYICKPVSIYKLKESIESIKVI